MSIPTERDWSYQTPPETPRDEVRFYLGDTDPAMKLISDDELDYMIGKWMPIYDSVIYVAAMAADIVASRLVSLTTVTADGVTVDAGSLYERYRAVAKQLRTTYRQHQVTGEIDLQNIMVGTEWDHRIEPLLFGIGMHDNAEAGQQSFGGTREPFIEAERLARNQGTP